MWVPFELGRPLGVPNDSVFQKKVLLSALRLLEASRGPVIEDFPEDAPVDEEELAVLACPVDFRQEATVSSNEDQLYNAFRKEMASLRPWYDISLRKKGRTTVGVSGIDLDKLADFVYSFVKGDVPENPREDVSLSYTLKFAADDLKAYYFEGITAQPGQENASSQLLTDWFWYETSAGKVLLAIKEASKASEHELMKIVGRALIVPSRVDSTRIR